jgi:asparaginyl-tRNA synthetase
LGYSYVILRCGNSKGKDVCFEEFYAKAKEAGLNVGTYYYSYATTVEEAIVDAENCLSWIRGKKFEYPVQWGIDLQTEHERYLTEEIYKAPVFVTDYPKDIKAFYMRLNDDGKTVAACDLLVPGVGEIIGGSQREERYDVLEAMMKEKNMTTDTLQWYMDLRRFGGCKHAGFGLGFDRFLMYLTGMGNIRDTEPFPRTPRNLKF